MIKNQKGLTLIEMMIAIVIGLIITSAVMTMFISNIRSNRDSVAMIRLNQELRGTMTFISDELKRAGYSANPEEGGFIGGLDPVNTRCFLYSYDENGDGVRGVAGGGTDERFGFRVETNDPEPDPEINTNSQIKWGKSATNACTFGTSITDRDIVAIILNDTVTSGANPYGRPTNCLVADYPLSSITLTSITAGTVLIKQVEIVLTGKTTLSGNTEVCRTVKEIIRLRNDDV